MSDYGPLTPKGVNDAYELMEKLRSEHNGIEAIDVGMAHAGDTNCRIIYNGGREVFACAPDILQSIKKAQAKWEDARFNDASPELRSDMLWWFLRRLEKRQEEDYAILLHATTDHERQISGIYQRLERLHEDRLNSKPATMQAMQEAVDECDLPMGEKKKHWE